MPDVHPGKVGTLGGGITLSNRIRMRKGFSMRQSIPGPAECELAVKKLYDSLKKEFPDIEMISCHEAKRPEGCTSILF